MRYFRLTNRIERVARDEQSGIKHYALVLVIVLAESVANAYFFAQGNDLGYLGGMMQALLISVVNVGVSVAVGKFWLPQKNHYLLSHRFLGLAAIPVHVFFFFFFNLLAAHYRDVLSTTPDRALAGSVSALLARPFHLSFESFMMFTAGIVAAGLGVRKGLSADDPYPGYGEVTRQYNEARDEFVAMRGLLPDCPYDQPDIGDDA